MRASWHALHVSLTRSSTTLSFQRRYAELRGADPALRRFPDPAALFDWLHAPDGDAAARNAALRALVRLAQREAPDTAATLLLLALWPGLDAVRRRLGRYFRQDPDALASELTARVTSNIAMLDLSRVTWIAATLLRNVERDVRRSLRADQSRTARRVELTEADIAGHRKPTSMLAIPEGLDADQEAMLIADRLHRRIGDNADLVIRIAVQGDRRHEAAEALRLTPEAASKRYQRALARLREEFAEAA